MTCQVCNTSEELHGSLQHTFTPKGEHVACTVCGQAEGFHASGMIRHAFTPPGERVDTSQFARKRPNDMTSSDDINGAVRGLQGFVQTPFDPVLRLALIKAGVLTPQQLEDAQREMTLLTGQVTGGMRDAGTGQGSMGSAVRSSGGGEELPKRKTRR